MVHIVNQMHIAERSSRVTAKRDARIDQILSSAMDLVQAEGLEALTLQRVAASVNVVTTGLYRYFPSKDALVAAMQRRSMTEVSAHFQRARAEAEVAWADATSATRELATLLLSARLYLELPETKPREWFFIALLLGDPRVLVSDAEAAASLQAFAPFLAELTGCFARAAELEALSPGPEGLRLFAFWAALHGAMCLEKLRRLSPLMPRAVDVGALSVRGLLVSWGASAARLTAAEKLVSDRDKGKRRTP